MNAAYRWFLGHTMPHSLPHFAANIHAFCHRFTAKVIEGVFRHFAAISHAFCHRFAAEVIEGAFRRIPEEAAERGTRHIRHDCIERAEDIRHSAIGRETCALRSQTIERVFADAKTKYAMRYTSYRGQPAVTAWVKLKFAAMNLKKLTIHKWISPLFRLFFS